MECSIGDVKVHYHVYGSGRPILMIHGFSLDHRVMTGCMEPVFTGRVEEWKRIYIDLPGMGQSKEVYGIQNSDDMLDVVLQFIDRIIPDESFLVAGQSYGGYLARGIIAKRKEQVDGAAFICPLIIADMNGRTLPPHTVIHQDEQLLSRLSAEEREEFRSISVVLDETNWRRYREEILAGAALADESFLDKLKKQYAFSFDVDERLSPYEKPCLFLLGRQDAITGYEDAWRILDRFPRATFAVLDRAGHNLQLEQPALFHAMVNEWLNRVVENAGGK
ncbi:alpha/beta fold hydrolase [Laceyella putida]|uniref:Alpha/beta fold hydrolase n=1 Tax=Laceyella putida TaxID=110101 RepID=A0ABW2RQ35_9BACL